MPTLELSSNNPDQTIRVGLHLGNRLKGGEIVELISDLGGGKTTLVKGLAEGAGSRDHVSSPTFTVSQVYKTPKLNMYHFDFYRLSEPGVATYELAEVVADPQAVVMIEWGDGVQSVLPAERLTINLRRDAGDEQKRDMLITYADKYSYLIEDLIPLSDELDT